MANQCTYYKEKVGLLPTHPDYHTCGTCMWIDSENPNRCNPPNMGCCSTEDSIPKMVERQKYQPLVDAVQEFIDRCDRGEIRSKYTYAKFARILTKLEEDTNG